MLKYAELRGDTESTVNPWTIRQVAIYQKFDIEMLQSDYIFIRLSTLMQIELQNALQKDMEQRLGFMTRWESAHLIILRTLNENWRQFICYLDEGISDIVKSCFVSADVLADPSKWRLV